MMRSPSLRWRCWSLGFVVVTLLTVSMVASAQTDDLLSGTDTPPGPVGGVDGTVIPAWEDLPSYSGPKGRTEEYLPHEACDLCFTLPNYRSYQIYEYAESDVPDGAIIISREIPNPAPEIRERPDYDPEIGGYYDPETGERVWFIGTQEIVGPTDEEKWSPDLPVSTIEMKRIQARHMIEIMDIEGVNAFGIGKEGFEVDLESEFEENRKLIPDTLEGIPVKVEIVDGLGAVLGSQNSRPLYDERIRPIPAGVSVGVEGFTTWGTLGPHVVRDTDTASNGRCCQMLSMTAAHVVNPENAQSGIVGRAVYSPGRNKVSSNRIGTVDYVFSQKICGYLIQNPDNPDELLWPASCSSGESWRAGTINFADEHPDIALISYGWKSVPYNDPSDAEPTRRMQYRYNKSVRGPSGRTKMAEVGHRHKIWGSRTPAGETGGVIRVNTCHRAYLEYQVGSPVFRYCEVNEMDYGTQGGDSGALVAYKGEGKHYIAGVFYAFKTVNDVPTGSWYAPADKIMEALREAERPISHYWGTNEDQWRPATDRG